MLVLRRVHVSSQLVRREPRRLLKPQAHTSFASFAVALAFRLAIQASSQRRKNTISFIKR